MACWKTLHISFRIEGATYSERSVFIYQISRSGEMRIKETHSSYFFFNHATPRLVPEGSIFIDHSVRMSNRMHKPLWWGNGTPRPEDWNPSNEEVQGVPYPFSCNTETVFWFPHFLCAVDEGSRYFFLRFRSASIYLPDGRAVLPSR